ncbi:MAG: GIY-YIG nuclease family protein [Caldilineaceae bacterium]|nr:GIY-YIG nuclease family protein [Caldilineaceae bacterium]
MNEAKQGGIVYVLENPAMPGLVKIGRTGRNSMKERLNDLYNTSVPVPFDCVYAAKVSDDAAVERAFHEAFGPYRINPKREFFEIESGQAIALLRLIAVENVTPDVQKEAEEVDSGSQASSKKLRSRRPNLNFNEMGMPVGAHLKFTHGDAVVEVISHNRVKYRDEDYEYSLTGISKRLLNIAGDLSGRTVAYWTYMGESLLDIYDRTYGQRE